MKFHDRFLMVLEQDAVEAANTQDTAMGAGTEPGEAAERQAMADTLDKGTRPEDFDVPVPSSAVSDAQKHEQINELKTWIAKVDNFIDFLNSPTPHSLQSKLHTAGCDTLFDSIARSEKKKISRLAAELSSLSESMKGYLISAHS
jgi:hypothetical protein